MIRRQIFTMSSSFSEGGHRISPSFAAEPGQFRECVRRLAPYWNA